MAILGETALSFLGIGLRPPVTSWGVVLNEAQDINVIAVYPWLLLPVIPLFLVVLAFNFLGDGLRDAADPYNWARATASSRASELQQEPLAGNHRARARGLGLARDSINEGVVVAGIVVEQHQLAEGRL